MRFFSHKEADNPILMLKYKVMTTQTFGLAYIFFQENYIFFLSVFKLGYYIFDSQWRW